MREIDATQAQVDDVIAAPVLNGEGRGRSQRVLIRQKNSTIASPNGNWTS